MGTGLIKALQRKRRGAGAHKKRGQGSFPRLAETLQISGPLENGDSPHFAAPGHNVAPWT